MEDFLVPVVISVTVSVVLAVFYARARRRRLIVLTRPSSSLRLGGNPIRISQDGVHYESWRWLRRFIRWEDIVELEHNTGNNAITVRGRDGKRIVHQLRAAPEDFKRMVQRKTKLPLTIATPGVWKVNKTQVPYQEWQ